MSYAWNGSELRKMVAALSSCLRIFQRDQTLCRGDCGGPPARAPEGDSESPPACGSARCPEPSASHPSCPRAAGRAPTVGHGDQPTRRVPPFACRCDASAISISCRCHSLMASCNGPGLSTGCLNRVETSIVSSCEPRSRSGLSDSLGYAEAGARTRHGGRTSLPSTPLKAGWAPLPASRRSEAGLSPLLFSIPARSGKSWAGAASRFRPLWGCRLTRQIGQWPSLWLCHEQCPVRVPVLLPLSLPRADHVSPPFEQQIRFCTSCDGVRIAYATVGGGPPLVKAANWLSHLEFDSHSPVWRHWIRELSRHHTLVRYDERGCGLSDRVVEEFSLEAWVRDLEAVIEASKLERFPLLGLSQGGPIAITYAVRHPEKVSHHILYGSYALGLKQRNLPEKALEEAELFSQLIRVGWGKDHPAFRQVFTSLFMPEATAEEASWFNELQRVSSSPENAARMLAGFHELNVAETAAQLNVPTLVLHAHGDLRIPFDEGRRLAALIPNSHFVPLYSRNHILLKTEPAWQRFLSEVRSFLGVEPTDQHSTLLKMPPKGTQSPQVKTESPWKEISALFEQAAGLGLRERDLLLNRVEDPDVRSQVETLLENDDAVSFAPQLTEIVKGSILSFNRVDDLEGRTISHYRVLEKLGEGGMGTVYKARDDRLDRFVALKFLPAYLSAKPELKNRFIQEAKAAAALDHANICTVYEIGEGPDGQLFISMACYEGETLRDKIDRGPLPLDLALAYAVQTAQGLAQAHAAGIVHRDIKPANLFITTRSQVKILDFGIAKVADVHLTNAGILVGTVAYMSPEQGDGRATDNRTDMWSQ